MNWTRIAFMWMPLLFAVPIPAQSPAEESKPAPAAQRLAYWVGTWKAESGEDSETSTFEWFPGGFGVVGRTEGKGPEGKYSGLSICSYDPDAKIYTLYVLNSNRPGRIAKGTATGNTWQFEAEGIFDGKSAKYRQTIVEATPKSRSFKAERSVNGEPWTIISMGMARKVE
jgi:hypothetical protein